LHLSINLDLNIDVAFGLFVVDVDDVDEVVLDRSISDL